jgi:type I restriction enzyme S subunit
MPNSTPSISEIPEPAEGWESTRLGDIAEVVGGGTPRASDEENFSEDGRPWVTPADLSGFNDIYIAKGRRSLSEKGLKSCSATMLPKGAVLMSSRAPIGYLAVAANPISTNQGFKSFICKEGIQPEYVYFWLKYITPLLEEMGSGSTFAEISGSRAREIPVLVAPTREQKRIVERVEALLGRVNAARERLDKVPAILKRFRQSVLAAACSGRLTEDWRERQGGLPSANDLLGRSSTEGLAADLDDNLPDLPESWAWGRIHEIAEVRGGIQKQPIREPKRNSFPYLRVANVLRGKLDLTEMLRMELFDGELEKYRLQRDDLLIVEGNGSLSEIGRSAIWTGEIENCVHQNHIIRVRPRECLSRYLNAFWNSPLGIERISAVAVTTSGLYSLSTKKVAYMPVPLAPLDEQREIVRRVGALLRLADAIEQRIHLGAVRTNKLTQAILAKAFRGELVPTEAEVARREGREYEPARAMLERMKRQGGFQAGKAGEPQTQKRGHPRNRAVGAVPSRRS